MPDRNKTKIAKRVIEVFKYFTNDRYNVRVADIVRYYGRPQSSTSELLTTLVEMGLLYKDPITRSYSPTPRMATIGASGQPELIRDQRLFASMDQLACSTGNGVALFGMVGTNVQIFRWSRDPFPNLRNIRCGSSIGLAASTAGHLMLAALPSVQVNKILWRIKAEADIDVKFDQADLNSKIEAIRNRGYATGPVGFSSGLNMTGMLLPWSTEERPLAVGIIYSVMSEFDFENLTTILRQCIAEACPTPEVNAEAQMI